MVIAEAGGKRRAHAGSSLGSDPKLETVMKRRLLLAEDNLFLSEIMQKELEALNYDVKVAKNGLEAVEMAISETPDVIIMDLMMPGLDGFEAASKIRRNPKTRTIPMLATTAITVTGARERCLASGFDDCISKPFTFWELRVAVEEIFKRRSR